MRLYSLHRPRLLRQAAADLLAIVGILTALIAGARVRDHVLAFAEHGAALVQSGRDLGDFIDGLAAQTEGIPFLGPGIAEAVRSGAVLPEQLTATGRGIVDAVDQLAQLTWSVTALAPVVAILIVWLPWRVRFAARSRTTASLLRSEAGIGILAARAMGEAPAEAVLSVHPDPAAAVVGDPQARRALAALTARTYGLSLPTRVQ